MRLLALLLTTTALCAAAADLELAPADQLQADAVAYAEAQTQGLPGSYSFRVVRPPTMPHTALGGKLAFEPAHLSRRDLGGYFFVSFKTTEDGRPLGMVRVDLEGKWKGQLLRTQTTLPRKAVPTEGQCEVVTFEGAPPPGALSEFPTGYRLRSSVGAGHILVQQDLEAIPVVLAGETVRLEMVSGPLVIALEAMARSNGAVGDKVRLEMPTTHKNMQAEVIAPGEARVLWAGGN
jgi:flagella basal body P-ring formation protein FlgA